jgi:hypothetical protein
MADPMRKFGTMAENSVEKELSITIQEKKSDVRRPIKRRIDRTRFS